MNNRLFANNNTQNEVLLSHIDKLIKKFQDYDAEFQAKENSYQREKSWIKAKNFYRTNKPVFSFSYIFLFSLICFGGGLYGTLTREPVPTYNSTDPDNFAQINKAETHNGFCGAIELGGYMGGSLIFVIAMMGVIAYLLKTPFKVDSFFKPEDALPLPVNLNKNTVRTFIVDENKFVNENELAKSYDICKTIAISIDKYMDILDSPKTKMFFNGDTKDTFTVDNALFSLTQCKKLFNKIKDEDKEKISKSLNNYFNNISKPANEQTPLLNRVVIN